MLELPDIQKKNCGSRPVTHAIIEYPSLAEACRKLHLKRGRVYNFLQRGISAEEALEKAIKAQKVYDGKSDGRTGSNGPAGNPCVIDGISFQSRKEACAAFQLSYPSVMSRIQRHPEMSFVEALQAIPPFGSAVALVMSRTYRCCYRSKNCTWRTDKAIRRTFCVAGIQIRSDGLLKWMSICIPPKVESASTSATKRPRRHSFSHSNSLCAIFFCYQRGSTVRKRHNVWKLSTSFILSSQGFPFEFWRSLSGPAVCILRPGKASAVVSLCSHCIDFSEQLLRCTADFYRDLAPKTEKSVGSLFARQEGVCKRNSENSSQYYQKGELL